MGFLNLLVNETAFMVSRLHELLDLLHRDDEIRGITKLGFFQTRIQNYTRKKVADYKNCIVIMWKSRGQKIICFPRVNSCVVKCLFRIILYDTLTGIFSTVYNLSTVTHPNFLFVFIIFYHYNHVVIFMNSLWHENP